MTTNSVHRTSARDTSPSSSYVARSLRVARELLEAALEHLIPTRCLGCQASPIVDRAGRPWSLCAVCLSTLLKPTKPGCWTCGHPLAAPDATLCGRCRRRPPPWDHLSWCWPYLDVPRSLLHAFKFEGLEFLATPLGHRLAYEVERRDLAPEIVTFVPMPWWRRRARGFDPAESLARACAARLQIPVQRSLLRRGIRKPQRSRSRAQRLRLPTGAFRVRGQLAGARVLLVDDILTTGATVAAGARCLREAGAKVYVGVIARTPRPSEDSRRE